MPIAVHGLQSYAAMLPDQARWRLWPTRKLFEGRRRQLGDQLGSIRGDVSALAGELAGMRGELADLRGEVANLRAEVAQLASADARLLELAQPMFEWSAEQRTRLRRTQALTARTYEALQDWPSQLKAARASDAYERAYTDDEPLVSVLIPTYHSPDTLCDRALASVLAQTHANWEAIVVGDHCTDDTEARVLALGDARIRFHNLEVRENDPADPWERWAVSGSVPRATAVELSRGLWMAGLSHDDAWDPDHLTTLLEAARRHRAELVYSRMRMVDGERPDGPSLGTCGAWPPRLGAFNYQSSIANGALKFLRYDRACALASEPNDWNLARRAWEAGVRFKFVDRETSTLYRYPRMERIQAELEPLGLPMSAIATT